MGDPVGPGAEDVDCLLDEPRRRARKLGAKPAQVDGGRLLLEPASAGFVGPGGARPPELVDGPGDVGVDDDEAGAIDRGEPGREARGERGVQRALTNMVASLRPTRYTVVTRSTRRSARTRGSGWAARTAASSRSTGRSFQRWSQAEVGSLLMFVSGSHVYLTLDSHPAS